jgi:predicted O-methyltransferase YrrM
MTTQLVGALESPIRRRPALAELTPILFGHAAFQYLAAAAELGLFELLYERPNLPKDEIRDALGLASRAGDILLLGTTALGLTALTGAGGYALSSSMDQLLAGGLWPDLRNVVAFEAEIVYEGQADFAASLRANANVGIDRIPGSSRDLYRRLSENPRLQHVFYEYMNSWSRLSNGLLLDSIDWDAVETVLDVGGGDGVNALALARAFPHLRITILELPEVATKTRALIERADCGERVRVVPCDILAGGFPGGYDCVLFAHQLVIWTPEENVRLLEYAHDALGPDGQVVIFNSMSDDAGDGPLMAALDSVYFAVLPAEGGMIYSWRQFEEWLTAAGFSAPRRLAVDSWTPHGVIVARR